jgi:DNA-binding CsgD family transcriptional regulator
MAAGRSPEFAVACARRTQAAHSAHLAGEPAWAGRLSTEPRGSAIADPVPPPDIRPGSAGELAPLIRIAWMRGDDAARDDVRSRLSSGRPIDPPLLGIWARAMVEDAEREDEIQRALHEYDRSRRADGMSPDQRAMALGTIALARHETAQARRHLTRALALAPPGGLHRPMALGGLAWAHFDAGDLDTARSQAAEALTLTADPRSPAMADVRVGALATLAAVALLRESPDQEERLREALDAMHPERHAVHHLRLERIRGVADERDGRGDLAYRRLRRLYHPDGRPVHHRISDLGLADLSHAAIAIGAADEVHRIVDAAEPRVRALRSARVSAAWHRAQALLAGTDPAAESWHRLALTDPGGDQWPIERALARFDYAQWLRRRQRPGESRPQLAAAAEAFAAAGLTSWSARATAELEAAAPPRRRRRDGAGTELTPQQKQVATLAAQGLTNQQIATRLALSARTVGTHLSRTYAILGISRRSQLPSVVDPTT